MFAKQPVFVRLALVFSLLAVLTLGLARTASATEFINNGQIPAGQVIDDDVFLAGAGTVDVAGTVNGTLFASGNVVRISGVVNGDLVVSGSEVEISGSVGGNLIVSAGVVRVNGPISGSVMAAGYSVEFGPLARVNRNVYATGFAVQTDAQARIGRDLQASGYQFILNGELGRDLNASGGAAELNGRIGGDVNLNIGAPDGDTMPDFSSLLPFATTTRIVPPGLRVAETAVIEGELKYESPVDQRSEIKSMPGGGITFRQQVASSASSPAQPSLLAQALTWLSDRLRDLVTLLVLGALAIWRLPAWLERAGETARQRPLPALGAGLATFFGGYLAAGLIGLVLLLAGLLLGLVSLGGLFQTVFGVGFSGLSLAMALFSLMVSYGSKLIVAYLAGRLIVERLLPQYASQRWLGLSLGVLIYVFLSGLPVLGFFVMAAATLAGLGALWLMFSDWRRQRAAPPAA